MPFALVICQVCQGAEQKFTPEPVDCATNVAAMLESGFTSVLASQTRIEFKEQLVGFTRRLGFETVTATLVIDHFLGDAEFIVVDNTPKAYQDAFHDPGDGRRDPVMQHCKRHTMPIIWGQETYTDAGQGDKWEAQAKFGYKNGICMALHMPEGRHFVLGVDRDRPLPDDAGEATRLVADLQLFVVYAQDAALRVLAPSLVSPLVPALTPRELETLRWTMEGKTAWEVGNLLGISERTAALHVNNAAHKLGCVNKHQAVLKALRLGMIR